MSDIIPLNAPSPISSAKSEGNSGAKVPRKISPITTENKPVLSFGSPVLLLSSSCSKPNSKEPGQNYSFGKPLALLQGNSNAGHYDHPSIVNRKSSFNQTDEVDIDLTLNDWKNDDNERSFEFKTEDDWMIPGNTSDNVTCVGTLWLRHCSFHSTFRK
jgi:hypothetical protein